MHLLYASKARHKLIAVLLLTLLVGCVNTPKTASELHASDAKSEVFCYTDPPPLIVQRIHEYLRTCYSPWKAGTAATTSGMFIPISYTIDWKITEEVGPDHTSVSLSLPRGYALTTIVKEGEGACASTMQAYAVTSFWSSVFTYLDVSNQGGAIQCKR